VLVFRRSGYIYMYAYHELVWRGRPFDKIKGLVCLASRTCVRLRESGATNQIAWLLINAYLVRTFLAHCDDEYK